MLDLEPAARVLAALVEGVQDDQLGAPTPCTESCLGDVIDHIDGLSMAFTAAATKTPLEGGNQGPSADASRLGTDWRARIPERLEALAAAWRREAAWEGMTRAGGVDLPAAAGVAAFGFVQSAVAEHLMGSPGLFGPPVPVAEDAPLIDRLIGLTGRDPEWTVASAG